MGIQMNLKAGDKFYFQNQIQKQQFVLVAITSITEKQIGYTFAEHWNSYDWADFFTTSPIKFAERVQKGDFVLASEFCPVGHTWQEGFKLKAPPACECGKLKHGFASHSPWCPAAPKLLENV